jgi:hypothetical protein
MTVILNCIRRFTISSKAFLLEIELERFAVPLYQPLRCRGVVFVSPSSPRFAF